MVSSPSFAPDFLAQPYWWDRAAPQPLQTSFDGRPVDVAIVGSGYTGLAAALTLLRAGRSVLVLDSEDPGHGASRRNAGYVGRTLKKSFPELLQKKGLEHALAVYRELDQALQTVRGLIREEGIDCHLEQPGRFIAATSPAHYEELARDLAVVKQHLGFDYEMLPRAEVRREMASDIYHGGAVIPDNGCLHPGLYHKGLLETVLAAGGIVRGRTAVLSIEGGARKQVKTTAGTFEARDVVVATNGYTPRALPWHARRVIPFQAYMAATEELPEELLRRQLPFRRTVIDSNTNIDYVRPAPDSRRLLFGGATGFPLEGQEAIATTLSAILGRVLPDMAEVRLSRLWTGFCAGTFDMMPHLGCHDGIWYGFGYNFAGVPMGTYFGTKIAAGILGRSDAGSVFSQTPPPTLPFYRGNPWFVPRVMRHFDRQDRKRGAVIVRSLP